MTAPALMLTLDCDACSASGEVDGSRCEVCWGETFLWACAGCGDALSGCVWNGGRCLDCHERGLLPETALDRWEAAYAD